ncbi:MAG: glycoside hydrolase family 15 protein [Bosea sp. (in: a-proteobacteria)]|uniref:glycoside hydrolase family 15 protein n=1 Tax=unclassified Bosea (in: a-proteobacteria) TaxID=2653178 RepID=UPI00095E751A|nr:MULTISPECIES: glycoside hydrolase family 15 protein [unclassified Bosea (in: a-proteobacteria)]MBN9444300.1 glycoside hydrolase family 15 protein [Bosea sp. (in: a-proteobacteria)]MBN9458602.1 glycoside hydrolase family 15 protein [Bosea sp. (in: a-proteobacteria)]OJV07419.1 MAG: glucoamylase [Bosea sp. 67-29]
MTVTTTAAGHHSASLDLGVIGNCSIAALIDRRARIVWGCFPRFDRDPVFCSLINNEADDGDEALEKGFFGIELVGMTRCEQSYLDNTAILSSVLSDDQGNAIEILDFAPRFVRYERFFRPPQLVRRVRRVSGRPRIRVLLKPCLGIGEEPDEITRGSNHVRFVGADQTIRLTTNAPLSYVVEGTPFAVDHNYSFFIGSDEALRAEIETTSREFLDKTTDYWRDWVRSLSIPFEYQTAVIRAAITLKLCSFEETGAIVAALTTSIPEAPGTQRNWDYRYCWLRDAYFVVHALNRLGTTRTMEDYLGFITNIVDSFSESGAEHLPPLYPITRGGTLTEFEASHLTGYRGHRPVRFGNGAAGQIQNDGYGAVVLAATHSFFDRRLIQPGKDTLFGQLERMGELALGVFDKPDAGPWELREKEAVHAFSSVMCWAACDRLARIAGALGRADRKDYWKSEAKRLRGVISERIWNEHKGHFVSTFDGEDLDATLLLLAELGFVKADDARFVATVEAIGRDLKRGDLLLRYATQDDFGYMHTGFLICAFWYVDALNAIGRGDEAKELFERILQRRNSFGLLSEDADLKTGELWGNFPQTYSMVGMINCAMRLSRDWEEAF